MRPADAAPPPAHRHPRPAPAWPGPGDHGASGTRDPGPGAAGPACLRRIGRGVGWGGVGWGEGRGGVRRGGGLGALPPWDPPGPAPLGGRRPPPPPLPPPRPASPPTPPTPPPRPSLLRATWPRSSLASGPAGARGPLSLLRACAQPSRGPERPSCPAPARCPKPPGATSAVNQELVRPAPPLRPPEAPLAPTPPSKHRTFRREQTSDVQAHGQTHRHSQAPTPRETAGRRKRGSQGHSHSTRGRPGVRRDRDRKR